MLDPDNAWYDNAHNNSDPAIARAATLAAAHADTPQTQYMDSLGRPFITEDDNKADGKYRVHQTLDIAGRPVIIKDAKDRDMTTNLMGMQQAFKTFNIDSGTRHIMNDVAGKPIYKWDDRGHRLKHIYDELQRPLKVMLTKDSSDYTVEEIEYGTEASKNNIGQVQYSYDQSGKTEIESYDFKGNPLQTTKKFAQEYKNYISWDDATIQQFSNLTIDQFNQSFTYDALNRPLTQTQPDGTVIAHTYNEAGLLETVAKDSVLFVSNINYNEKGQRTLITFGNGTETSYFYDTETFRLTKLTTTKISNGLTLQDLTYTYDPIGNIVEISDAAQETSYYNNSQVAPSHKYTYDALYRLLSGTGRELIGLSKASAGGYIADSVQAADTQAVHNYTQHFEYDELGNILKLQHVTPQSNLNWSRNFVYESANNRLLKHDTNQTTNDYQYDEHGNIAAMPHLPTKEWTFNDELKSAILNAGGDKAYYVYDASGNRTRKVVVKGNIREERYYLGNFEVYIKTTNGTLTIERTTVHVMDDKQRIATIDHETDGATTIRYQVSDHLGSASIELDENGTILTYEEYHPFGTTSYQKHNTDISQKRYKYVGKERDEETGLYNYGFRLYAPWLGRFISVDPLQHDYPYYTPFQYAGNKPIIAIDLDGLESKNVVQNEETGQQIQPPQVLQDNLKEQKPHVPELDAIWFKNEDGSFTLIDPHKNDSDQLKPYEKSLTMQAEEWINKGNVFEQALKLPLKFGYGALDDITVFATSQALIQDIVGIEDAINLNGTITEPREKLEKGLSGYMSILGPLLGAKKQTFKAADKYSDYANKINWNKSVPREGKEFLRNQINKSAIENTKANKQGTIFTNAVNVLKLVDSTFFKTDQRKENE